MKQCIIPKGSKRGSLIFKPHFNKKKLTYLIKCKTLNSFLDEETDQRTINSLFGLTYGLTSIGFGFNIKDDLLYIYGYHKSGNIEDIEYITKCDFDSYYYLGFKVNNNNTITFEVQTFKRRTKATSTIKFNNNLFPLGLHTYPSFDTNYVAQSELTFLMSDYSNLISA